MNISVALPQQCVVCGRSVTEGTGVCQGCHDDLPLPVDGCLRCAVELGNDTPAHGYCHRCLSEPPAFDRCIAAFRYDYPVRELISRFKYHAHFAEGRALALLLAEKVSVSYAPGGFPGCLLPVPLHPRRLRERGYNQSVELARVIGRQVGIPVSRNYCRRIRSTPHQQGLSADERAVNLSNAFSLDHPRSGSASEHIAIVDDVVTTMTTVDTISRLLRAAGHSRIDVICLARVS